MPRLDLTHIVLHHTAAEEKDTEQIRKYHIGLGWRDIGYDYVIEKDGKTVEGRSLSIQGAHAGVSYYNQHSIGVAVIGNLSKREIYPEQFDALIDLLYDLILKWRIPVRNVITHREIKATECPGKNFPYDKVISVLEERLAEQSEENQSNLPQEIQSLMDSLWEERNSNNKLKKQLANYQNAINEIEKVISNVKRQEEL